MVLCMCGMLPRILRARCKNKMRVGGVLCYACLVRYVTVLEPDTTVRWCVIVRKCNALCHSLRARHKKKMRVGGLL